MTPQEYTKFKAKMREEQDQRDRDGAKKLGVTVTQFRSLKANALRRAPTQTRSAAPEPASAPRKRMKCLRTVITYPDGSRKVIDR